MSKINEDGPTMSAGGGGIASIGVPSPSGTPANFGEPPGIPKARLAKQPLKRKAPNIMSFKSFVKEAADLSSITRKEGQDFSPPEYGKGGHFVAVHKGKHYHYTGKTGNHIKSGMKSYEYSHSTPTSEKRIWIRKDGTVDED